MGDEAKTKANEREVPPSSLQLIVMAESGSQRIDLPRGGTVTLGRGEGAEVRIDDSSISRSHAALHVRNTLQLEDLGSSNGTFLHGARLEPQCRVDLAAGEFFEVGSVVCVVRGIDNHDPLRQLRTHEHFEARLQDEVARARRARSHPAVIRIRIDEEEDMAIAALLELVRPGDVMARYAPGEYEVLLVDPESAAAAELTSQLARRLESLGRQASFGVAVHPHDGSSAEELFAAACRALEPETSSEGSSDLVIESSTMRRLHELLTRIAAGGVNVLLLGETGVGKEVFASRLHAVSPRAGGPLVKLNCAAFTDTLLDSELFGHEKGAFTGDAANLYVAGDQGTLLTYDGVAWRVAAIGTSDDLHGVWSTDGLVVAVGSNGTIVQDDGTGWVRGRTTTTANLLSVWGSANEGFFITGEQGTLLFYDGRVWRPLALGRGITGSPNQTFFSVAGVPGEVSVIGTHDLLTYEGAAWSPTALPTAQTITGLWGSGPDDVFAVGRNGTILHHDGLAWTLQPSSTTLDLHAVWGTAPDDVYAVGDALTLLHYDGASWTTLRAGPADGLVGEFLAVFAAAPGDVVAAGTTGLYHYDGAALVRTSSVIGRALWGTSTTNIFAAGAGIQRFDGSVWSPQPNTTGTLLAVAGSSPNNVYAVGSNSYSFDGTSWTAGPFSGPGFAAVCASPDRGVFSAGQNGTLRHWNGGAIEPLVARTTADLDALFITGNTLFLAGADGTLDVMVFHQ